MPRLNDTIAALATPAGTGALAVLRASGPDTRQIATELLGRAPLPRVARHANYRDRAGLLVDDVMLTFFQGPQSYTGEDALEVSCHGNPFIAQKVLEDLFARGCRPAEPGEFTQRAFLNGRMDLSQAEAVMDLIHARSERALTAAQQQLRGALGRRVNDLIERLLAVLAQIEAYIDFPDEDLPGEDRETVSQELASLSSDTDRLLATSHYGELLRDGLKAVIVGEPNVGKSSLLNRLIGRERALVSAEPGTTRDFIEERIMIGPHCLRLIDTAGLNSSPAPLEALGMEKTRERLDEADVVIVVLDGSRLSAGIPASVLSWCIQESLIVVNKSDLQEFDDLDLLDVAQLNPLLVSAVTGAGIDQLVAALVKRADRFQVIHGEDVIAINARHAHVLDQAQDGLRRARELMEGRDTTELLASELRGVLAAYGEIGGKVDNERMLDHLFASFCIGK